MRLERRVMTSSGCPSLSGGPTSADNRPPSTPPTAGAGGRVPRLSEAAQELVDGADRAPAPAAWRTSLPHPGKSARPSHLHDFLIYGSGPETLGVPDRHRDPGSAPAAPDRRGRSPPVGC